MPIKEFPCCVDEVGVLQPFLHPYGVTLVNCTTGSASPAVDSIPIPTRVIEFELRPRSGIVVVECQSADGCIPETHDHFTQDVDAVIFTER